MIAWRFLIPRPGYFRAIKIASACPEIRGHLDRIALCSAGHFFVVFVQLLGFIAVVPIHWLAEKVRWQLGRLPDFSETRSSVLREAHSIVPVEEIRRRIGLPPERGVIMSKPPTRVDDADETAKG